MLFCDECDRGYHSFCVGLKQIPVGKDCIKLVCQVFTSARLNLVLGTRIMLSCQT